MMSSGLAGMAQVSFLGSGRDAFVVVGISVIISYFVLASMVGTGCIVAVRHLMS